MDWQIPVALVVMIPVILAPVMFVWLLNIGGLISLIKRVRERRVAVRNIKAEVNTD
jgi:hypothetical protein